MNLSALLKQPIFWIATVVLLLVFVLALWYVKRPTDADGNSLILTSKEEKSIRRDMSQQVTRRAQDSLLAARANSAATTLYRQGQQNADAARSLHQRAHENTPISDTAASQLQRKLSDY